MPKRRKKTEKTALEITRPAPGLKWILDMGFFKQYDIETVLDYGGRRLKGYQ